MSRSFMNTFDSELMCQPSIVFRPTNMRNVFSTNPYMCFSLEEREEAQKTWTHRVRDSKKRKRGEVDSIYQEAGGTGRVYIHHWLSTGQSSWKIDRRSLRLLCMSSWSAWILLSTLSNTWLEQILDFSAQANSSCRHSFPYSMTSRLKMREERTTHGTSGGIFLENRLKWEVYVMVQKGDRNERFI